MELPDDRHRYYQRAIILHGSTRDTYMDMADSRWVPIVTNIASTSFIHWEFLLPSIEAHVTLL